MHINRNIRLLDCMQEWGVCANCRAGPWSVSLSATYSFSVASCVIRTCNIKCPLPNLTLFLFSDLQQEYYTFILLLINHCDREVSHHTRLLEHLTFLLYRTISYLHALLSASPLGSTHGFSSAWEIVNSSPLLRECFFKLSLIGMCFMTTAGLCVLSQQQKTFSKPN